MLTLRIIDSLNIFKIMKKHLFGMLFIALLSSCTNNWEYKIVTVNGNEEASKFAPKEIKISNEDLNLFGKEGWELVDTYTTTESVHPNFGNDEYVNGLQPNVRTSSVNFVFKRKL